VTPSLRVKCEILEATYAAMPNGWSKKVLAPVYDPNGLVARLISARHPQQNAFVLAAQAIIGTLRACV